MTRFDHPLYRLKHGFKEPHGVARSTPKAIVFSMRRRLPNSLSVRPSSRNNAVEAAAERPSLLNLRSPSPPFSALGGGTTAQVLSNFLDDAIAACGF